MMKKTLLSIAAALVSAASFAQDVKVTMAADAPFKFSASESYVTIFLGDETRAGQSNLTDDNYIYLGPDGDNGRNLWVWDDTYDWPEKTDLNSFDVFGDYMSVSVKSAGWSGLGYNIADANPVNLSFIDSNWSLHLAVKMTSSATICFKLYDATENVAAIALGKTAYEDSPAIADFPRDGEWYNIDIPMSYLEDQFEFTFDGATRYKGEYFEVLGGGVEGTVINYDAVFFHGPKVDAGLINKTDTEDAISGIKVTKAADNAIYDLTGRRVANATKGIYIQNGKKYIK